MQHQELHLDWETRSACDIRKAGLYAYAAHPSTEIILASYAFDDGPVLNWFPGEPVPKEIKEHILSQKPVIAHNAQFEKIIGDFVGTKHGWPILSYEQIRCTMVQAYAMGLPGSLEKASAALGIEQQKDMKGHRLMMKMSQVKEILEDGTIVWHNDPTDLQNLASYGRQDVVVEREVDKREIKLSKSEHALWCLDQKINGRGVMVDLPAARKALEVVEKEKVRLNAAMQRVTKNAVATCTATGQLTDWIHFRGVQTEGVAKSDVIELLEDPALPPDVREAVSLRQEAAKSSTAKLNAMILSANLDGRVRGTLQFCGAGTGRWSGRRLQVQNFPRAKYEASDIDTIFDLLLGDRNPGVLLNLTYGSPLSVLSNVLRSFIVAAPGNRLIWCDFSAIEARVLAWLAGEVSVLKIFENGGDIYIHAAAKIFGVSPADVTKAQRQIGKVAVLALGYGGGKGAFQAMAKGYNVKVKDQEAESIKENWRASHQNIVRYWHSLNSQAINAVNNPGEKFSTGSQFCQVSYLKKGSFLWCQLPSGRLLCYPYPKIVPYETPWGEMRDTLTYKGEDSLTKKWDVQKAYGGLLAENITQAVARDLLAESIIRLEKSGYPVVLHVHDEIVCEVPDEFGSRQEMEEIMSEIPSWASGLPISVEGAEGKRYSK